MYDWIKKSLIRTRQMNELSTMLMAIRHGLTLMIPLMLMGSFAILLSSLPISIYKEWMTQLFGQGWIDFFQHIYTATFGIMSLLLVVVVSYLYISEKSSALAMPSDSIIASMTALACFVSLIGLDGKGFNFQYFGTIGLFSAIMTAVIASQLFLRVSQIKALSFSKNMDSFNPYFNNALKTFFPVVFTVLPFVIFGSWIQSLGFGTTNEAINNLLLQWFTQAGDTLLAAILFTFIIHFLWFFGIHGNNIVDFVSQNLYAPGILVNQEAILLGDQAQVILTKPFFDTFILLGGAGATLSLLLGIFIWCGRNSIKRLGRLALIPSLLNINELILFGLPIVMEPLFFIPFILVPVCLTITSYLAIAWGLVPYTQNVVEWTTPIFLSGYLVTESWRGSMLQLVNLFIGVSLYKPFLIKYEKMAIEKDLIAYSQLLTLLKESELLGVNQLLSKRSDDAGGIARMLITELEMAIRSGALAMHYQPQINAQGSVIGVESLLRWKHSRYGYIYPPLIFVLAEEGGLIAPLGHWIVDRVLLDTQKLNAKGYSGLTNAINLSAKQLENEELITRILKQMEVIGLRTSQIAIEITEHLALSSDPRIHNALDRLSQSGVKLAMDDFGMGHSSLLYLKSHQFDTIKLDGSLVKDLVGSHISQEIISSIYYLSQSLGFNLLAEFVETEAQRDKLFELGCFQYQGYLYSQALSMEDLLVYLVNMCVVNNPDDRECI